MKTTHDGTYAKTGENAFTVTAPGQTDLFVNPDGRGAVLNAPMVYVSANGDLDAHIRLTPEMRSTYDAGALIVMGDDHHWIKAGLELTDLGYPAIVSVVTDGVSDDANGEPVNRGSVWIRICRRKDLFSVHYSLDGAAWKMVRFLELVLPEEVRVGALAQSPTGDTCTVAFEEFIVENRAPADMRSPT